MNELILRNLESAQYIYGARKNFIMKDGVLSESNSKILICHISDIHSDIKRFENSIYYANYFGASLIIHTGDTVKWDMDSNYRFFNEAAMYSSVPIYNCIGNHETFRGNTKLSNEYLHEEMIQGLKNIHSPNGRGYYYVDFGEYNLRLIVLNNYDFDSDASGSNRERYAISQEQCDWLIATLKDSAEKNYGVIIASHESDIPIPAGSNNFGFCQRFKPYPWGTPPKRGHLVADIVDAFRHGKDLKLNMTWENTQLEVSVNTSFDKKGEFICYLNGHKHGDYVGYIPDYTDQLSIGMTCSGCYPEHYHNIGEEVSDLPRIPDTACEDCVNFYTIDRDKKIISIVRIGAVVNDELKLRRSLQLSYAPKISD